MPQPGGFRAALGSLVPRRRRRASPSSRESSAAGGQGAPRSDQNDLSTVEPNILIKMMAILIWAVIWCVVLPVLYTIKLLQVIGILSTGARRIPDPLILDRLRFVLAELNNALDSRRRPPVLDGEQRLVWKTAFGKELYMDIAGVSPEEAQLIQSRITQAPNLPPAPHNGPSGHSSGSISRPQRVYGPPPTGLRQQSTPEDNYSGLGQELLEANGSASASRKVHHLHFLLLCISAKRSEAYRPINLRYENVTDDHSMFAAVQRHYLEVKVSRSWWVKALGKLYRQPIDLPLWAQRWYQRLSIFTPQRADFISFLLVPLPGGSQPDNFTSSYPPESEVRARRWSYSPCPTSITEFRLHKSFTTYMMEPGHSYPNNWWLDLIPKKLDSELIHDGRGGDAGWGVHVVEQLDYDRFAWVVSLCFMASGMTGVIYAAVSKDPGSGFTIAGWFGGGAAVLIALGVFIR